MAENTDTPPAPVVAPLDTKANNDAVARKLASQDTTLAPSTDIGPASDALDKLAKAHTEKVEAEKVKPEITDPPTPPVKPPVTATPPAAPKVDDAITTRANEIFKDLPSLPAGASPKSSEAFAAIKIKAAQELAAREAELEKLKKEVSEWQSKAKTLTPEQQAKEKELEELRGWRTKLDVDFDPKFKTYDASIEKAREFVYAQLRKSSVVTDETLKQIKNYGGPDQCNLTKLFEAIKDPTIQRIVESQISEIEKTKYDKEQAVQAAKTNLTGYLGEREKVFKDSATAHTQATTQALSSMLGTLDWFKEAKAEGTPEEKTKAEEHNKFVSELRQQIDAATADDSPQMRAILITGMAQLFNLQKIHAGTTSELEATKKELADLTKKWEKVKASSTVRLEESQASPNGVRQQKPMDVFNTRAPDALDAIAKQVMEEKARVNQ